MTHDHESSRLGRALPWIFLVLALLYVGSAFRPVRDSAFALSLFGRLPIVDLGRTKPLDTFARTSLMVVSNKQTFYLSGSDGTSDREEKTGHAKTSALQWLLDVMARPEQARTYRVVRIDHPDIKSILGVEVERKYFSVDEILKHRDALEGQIQRAQQVPSGDRNPYQRQVLKLAQSLMVYFNIEDVSNLILVPPLDPQKPDSWNTLQDARHQADEHELAAPAMAAYTQALQSWHDENPAGFAAAVTPFVQTLESERPALMRKMGYETLFNHVAPFILGMGLYVLVALLALFSWLGFARPLSKAALWVLGVSIVLHTLGLVARVYIQGRPPVTNLYSSAIFTGWGAAILGFVLERVYRNGIGAVTAAGTGFLTLLVAHNLSLDGDTMTMMQAVLDTNFWLATHVVVITLGYASTFLAGFLGAIYILRGLFTRSLSQKEQVSLTRMIYGIVCFATLFSFVGTILGGIWADQSWGRFWGWDPKENGALLIVLWNALILHARWGGMIRQRGLAILAVTGNIVTAWSWFGTNMLGVGLHAYGFIDSAIFWMFVFVATQLGLIGLGLVPVHRWRSMQNVRAQSETPRPPSASPGVSPSPESSR